MVSMFQTWRPSTLAAACVPSAYANAAQVTVLGQPAVQTQVRIAPFRTASAFGHLAAAGASIKINNYIGTVAAATAEGATTSLHRMISAERVQTVQGDMVKGGDARGIPPRGTPV